MPRTFSRILVLLMFALLPLWCVAPTHAQAVAPDGSVGVNTLWEQGKSNRWFMEVQGNGMYFIQDGIAREDETLIQKGLLVYQWGADHEAADGSSTCNDAFHSYCFWVVYGAQGLLALKNYHPTTYTYNPKKYAAQIAALSEKIRLAAHWMLVPAHLQKGLQSDAPYTHRRYLLGSALAYAALLTGDTSLSDAAVSHVKEGLGIQLTPGWRAALTQNADGTYPPAVLVAPGDEVPAGATQVISAAGVNAEEGGYDVNYQCVSTLFAENYLDVTDDAGLQSDLRHMITTSLDWEIGRVKTDPLGILDATGSFRVFFEHNRDGTPKTPNYPEIIYSFKQASVVTGDPRYAVWGTRIDLARKPVSTTPVSAAGAVDVNGDYDAGKRATYSLSQQRLGAMFVQAGVLREDKTLIDQGLAMFTWGWNHQSKTDGSFPGTDGQYDQTAQFVEAAARAMLALKDYRPVTYKMKADQYAHVVSVYGGRLNKAAQWLMGDAPAAVSGRKTDAAYASRQYLLAAALGQTASLTGNVPAAQGTTAALQNALSLQTVQGMNPEAGAFDVNKQALGIQYAEFLLQAQAAHPFLFDTDLVGRVNDAVQSALDYEHKLVAPSGKVSVTSSPDYKTISDAFLRGFTLYGDPRLTVYGQRATHHP